MRVAEMLIKKLKNLLFIYNCKIVKIATISRSCMSYHAYDDCTHRPPVPPHSLRTSNFLLPLGMNEPERADAHKFCDFLNSFSVVGFAKPGEIFHNSSVCELVYMRAFCPIIVVVITRIGLFTLSLCGYLTKTPAKLKK
jgi:hypothetical protein